MNRPVHSSFTFFKGELKFVREHSPFLRVNQKKRWMKDEPKRGELTSSVNQRNNKTLLNDRSMYLWYITVLHNWPRIFLWINMSYEMKFSIYLYNLIRSTRIILDNRICWFGSADNISQSVRKVQNNLIFSDFDLKYMPD